MKRILAAAALAWMAGSALGGTEYGQGAAYGIDTDPAEGLYAQDEWSTAYSLRQIGRAEAHMTSTTLTGIGETPVALDRRALGQGSEARRIDEDLAGVITSHEYDINVNGRSYSCSLQEFRRDC